MKRLAMYVFLATLSSTVGAEGASPTTPSSNPELENNWFEKMNQIRKEGKSWANLEKATSRSRINDCMAAIGNKTFCDCLDKELNWAIGFDTYVRIITAPNAKPDPAAADPEGKAINTIFAAREQCAPENAE